MTADPEQAAEVADNRFGFAAQLPPGDPGRAPTFGQEDAIALAVGLEGTLRAVDRTSVELDGELLPSPEAVDFVEAATHLQVGVEARARQIVGVDEGDERLLEVVAGDAAGIARVQQRPQIHSAAMSRIPLEELWKRDPIHQATHVRLVDRPLELPLRKQRGQVEDGAKRGSDRDPVDLLDLVGGET